MRRIAIFVAAALIGSAALAQHASAPAAPKPPSLMAGIGAHHHPISTSSPEAQRFFDQGLTLLFGFNHEEAIRSFGRASELDPKAAMPHWGKSLALGANYNDPEPEAERLKKARAEIETALTLSGNGPENERSYTDALAKRYVADPSAAEKASLPRDYAAAMKELSARYPDDLDAATLYAESLMNLRPWKLWRADGAPEEGTMEIVGVLESVLKRDPSHPGANHYYIHAIEASPHPERALASAARLETLVPAAGHLVHMPAHIYIRTGDYVAAEKSNAVAANVDREYIRATGAQGMYPLMYYNHNVHFQSAAAAMAGRSAEAKKAADLLFADVLPAVAEAPMLEAFLTQPAFVAVRFRKWGEVGKMPDPGPKLPVLRGIWLFARGVAAASTGDRQNADAERKALAEARDKMPPETVFDPNNKAVAVFDVALNVLDARIAEAGADRKGAIESWRKAVAAEDALAYDEPPAWYYPVRESLGAALLRDGRPGEAETVFREDLERHPRNGRSLLGLSESLKAQKKSADAAWVRSQFETAWKDADVNLRVEDL